MVTRELGLRVALLADAVLVGVSALAGLLLGVPEPGPGPGPALVLGHAPSAARPSVAAGPVVVSVQYRVEEENRSEFLAAMQAIRLLRSGSTC